MQSFHPDLVINAAAYTAVDKAETEVELANAINARAPEVMAQYAAAQGATLLHYSTDYVFDGSKAGFYTEDDVRNPLGAYGKSKAAGEEAIEKALQALKDAHKAEDLAGIDAAMETLNTAWSAASEHMYAGNPQEAAANEGATNEKQDDNVADAEFEEVK